DLERQLPLMDQLIQREIDSFRIEKRNIRADGTSFWIDLMVTALRDPAGHSVNFIGFATEITQRKQLEADLVEELLSPRRQTEARRSQMQQAQQELFNQLAHDVRNALSSVGGFSQLLRRRKLVSGEAEAVVGRIQQAAEEAHQLLQEMLFARELELGDASGDGKLQLEQVIQDTLRWFGIQAREKELSFVGQVDQELPLPAIPPTWFERLLKQLLANALRFTPAGGEIRLRLSAPAGKLLLVVSDTGPGIPADMQPRLFEKAMLRDQRAGGMELYLAQQIVHQHGGRLWFESNAGAGTTFFLELPPL
ncbi:MAG TPA: ATP-binding protein, partial [Candidatus Obscuribacterales bacterium]